jgi:hypothetical protein
MTRALWRCYDGIADPLDRVVPNTIRVIPTTVVTFVVYENTKIYLPRFFEDESMAHGQE